MMTHNESLSMKGIIKSLWKSHKLRRLLPLKSKAKIIRVVLVIYMRLLLILSHNVSLRKHYRKKKNEDQMLTV